MIFERSGNLLLPKHIVRGGFRKYLDLGINTPTVRIKGRFKVELLDRQGRVKQKLEFDNLITNAALDKMAISTVSSLKTYAAVGTGSTAPSGGDTTLVAEISPSSSNRTNANGSVSETNTYVSGSPDYWERKTTYLFDFSQGNGNLTEIGLFSAVSSGTMWTRQLLKDSGGTPTTVTKTSSDQLRITYTLQTYPPTSDTTATVTISGTDYTITVRPNLVSGASQWGDFTADGPLNIGSGTSYKISAAYSGAIGTRTGSPAGTGTADSSRSIASYVSGNYYLDCTSIWSASVANYGAGGIPAVRTYGMSLDSPTNWSIFQLGISPFIPKDNTNQLTLVIRNSWGLYP